MQGDDDKEHHLPAGYLVHGLSSKKYEQWTINGEP
jgi:hypothetical protein